VSRPSEAEAWFGGRGWCPQRLTESSGRIAMRLGLTEAVRASGGAFLHSAVKGLSDRPKAGRKDHALSPETVDKLVHLAMSPPRRPARWTTRCCEAIRHQQRRRV